MADPARCRLYLTTPPELVSGGVPIGEFLGLLERACAHADVACLLIAAPADTADEAFALLGKPVIQAAQALGAAALIPDRIALAKQLAADGVHLDLREKDTEDALRVYRYARKELGSDAIVGVRCPPERHAAMELAEAGADYVGFDVTAPETIELVAWWGEVMTVPCVAFGNFDPGSAGILASAGADFLAPEPKLWSDVDPVPTMASLAEALQGKAIWGR